MIISIFSTLFLFKGKTITVKKADIKQGKVYVGKLPETGCDEEDIKNHFSQYGAIAEVLSFLF